MSIFLLILTWLSGLLTKFVYSVIFGPFEPAIRKWLAHSGNAFFAWAWYRMVKSAVTGRQRSVDSQYIFLVTILVGFIPFLFILSATQSITESHAESVRKLDAKSAQPAEAPKTAAELEKAANDASRNLKIWSATFLVISIVGLFWTNTVGDLTTRHERFIDRILPVLTPSQRRQLIQAESNLISRTAVVQYLQTLKEICEAHGFGDLLPLAIPGSAIPFNVN